ncbi:hypothetical protein L1049_006698 [Liquidambar formosana]|uniref:Uncharacterized protein n=1 Tax=Liquidambar formosana TaxID=63359 RepID=A0AAP0RFW6_LIQFO
MLMPSLAPSRSVREAIQEVKMVQIWGNMMRACELRAKELLDANVIASADLYEWLKTKAANDASIIGVGTEQIRVIKLGEGEVRFLEKVVLFGSNTQRMEEWENGSLVPQDALRAAQIQGISRKYELH